MSSDDEHERSLMVLAVLERAAMNGAATSMPDYELASLFSYGKTAMVVHGLLEQGVDLDLVAIPALRFFARQYTLYYWIDALGELLGQSREHWGPVEPGSIESTTLIDVWVNVTDGDGHGVAKRAGRLQEWIGEGPWQVVRPGEHWTNAALTRLEAMAPDRRMAWLALLDHCCKATSSKPSARWLKVAREALAAVTEASFRTEFGHWMEALDRGRSRPFFGCAWEAEDHTQRIHVHNANLLRGLIWLTPQTADAGTCRTLGQVARSAYRRVKGIGPRAVKVGNAAVWALGEVPGMDALGQLAMLKARISFRTALKGIEKAFNTAAEREKLPRDEIEEMAIPTYGLTEVGIRHQPLGTFTAELLVTGSTTTELRWWKGAPGDGKPQKSVPAAVKENFDDELKELKAEAKDIQKMLPAQRDRLDLMQLLRKSWPYATWIERYLSHPLVGTLARRLIWTFDLSGSPVDATWLNGQLVGADGEPLSVDPSTATVSLWHPIGHSENDVIAWRMFFEERQIQQPFKQAHREVYLLTDAEKTTGAYSNRFGAHLIKQHQFNALCGVRGWRNTLRLMVDDTYPPPSLDLPKWNLRAEFWVEAAFDEDDSQITESGTYLYLATDQVRFYPIDVAQFEAHAHGGGYSPMWSEEGDIGEPVPMSEIPPLVFSEVMRDVDLFVGVASVGNDPAWTDGGAEGHQADYWHSYAFGDLSATAVTRRDTLERLIPRLKIAPRCSFSDKFLVVRGDKRTYKIHLGSGNILMEPNDQYLCIVPARGAIKGPASKVFLPFEGDRTLSIILSKALMLAADTKITDSTVLSQIERA